MTTLPRGALPERQEVATSLRKQHEGAPARGPAAGDPEQASEIGPRERGRVGGRGRELWLVRHGETPASRDRRLAGWTDVPLTERGERQAAALRPVLEGTRFEGVWSSDLRRAVMTAQLAWGEARQDRRLRELSFGELEGVAYATMDARWQQGLVRFEGFEAPGGETLDDLHRRVKSFVDELSQGRHLVFTHGGVVRLLAREVGEDGFVPTGTLLVVDWEGRRLLSRRGPEGVDALDPPSAGPVGADPTGGVRPRTHEPKS